MLTGPAAEADALNERLCVVHARKAAVQAHVLARTSSADPVPPGWASDPVPLEELVLCYLREPGASALPGPASLGTVAS
jgi:ABC-2 type transport system ATP-binding protein